MMTTTLLGWLPLSAGVIPKFSRVVPLGPNSPASK